MTITFETLPAEKITRGTIMSMMDTEFPVVECYSDGKTVIPVACLNGLPIPYDLFVFYFCARFSTRVKDMVPWMFPVARPEDSEEPDDMLAFWDTLNIPFNMKEFINNARTMGSKSIIQQQIDLMFDRHLKKENPQESFRQMVTEIDRIYMNSFANPVTV